MRRMLARKHCFFLCLFAAGIGLFLLIDEAVDTHTFIPVITLACFEH